MRFELAGISACCLTSRDLCVARTPDVVLETPTRGPESFANGELRVGVRQVLFGRMADDNQIAWNVNLDLYAVEPSAMMVPLWRHDRDPAAHDSIEDLLEVLHPLADLGFERRLRRKLM
jgi:hypothetical protein